MSDKDIQQAMSEMDLDRSGEVGFNEFAAWWSSQRGKNGRWELDLLQQMGKTKRWAGRVGDGLASVLAHHYGFVLPAGSGANRRQFKPGKGWSRRAGDRFLRMQKEE